MSLILAAKDEGRETPLARYRAMAEEGSDIIVLHEAGRIVFATGSLDRLLKRTPKEMQASGYLNFVHPDDIAEALKLRGRPRPGEVWTATYRVRHGDGHYIWFETRTRGVYDETTGEFLREVSVGRDISERKENELRLRAAQGRAEAANRAKSAFLANMSHELRTPLNAIMGFADAMENQLFGPLGNGRYREYAASIRQEGERLLAMVSNILDVARIESGHFELQPEMVDVSEAVSECFGFVSAAAEKSGIALERALSADALWADASAVRNILLNLLSNAVNFTARGGRVRVETAREAGDFALRVRDSGCGMTEDQLLRLSQPFAQLCSEAVLARGSAGTGVGLALVRALTDAHGGCMHIDSAPGKGTTVSLRFPPGNGRNEMAETRTAARASTSSA